ncbi:MAG: GNAT family N-acetyltransferase [Candidatus Shapirobacteria bacterium]
MEKQINDKFVITDNFEINELVFFLKKIWGESSPLCHVEKTNKSQYCVIKNKDNIIIGCCGIKFLDQKTIELGSLATDPKYRGLGLARQLLAWQESTLSPYIKKGYQIITFATLGSNIMDFIISKLIQITALPSYPINITQGIVPIDKKYAKINISDKHFLYKNKDKLYTSTISILSTNIKSNFEEIYLTKGINLSKYLHSSKVQKTNFITKKNNYIDLTPLRFIIWNIFDEKTTIFPPIDNNKFYQIKIPILIKFETIHQHFKKMTITGFSIENNILFINYSNISTKSFNTIIKNLKTSYDTKIPNSWFELIQNINDNKSK